MTRAGPPALKAQKSQKASQTSQKAYSTRYSQAVSHPSTNQARPCLASEIRRDRARSGWYGRRRGRPSPRRPKSLLLRSPACHRAQPSPAHHPPPLSPAQTPPRRKSASARPPACHLVPPQPSAPARSRGPGPGVASLPFPRTSSPSTPVAPSPGPSGACPRQVCWPPVILLLPPFPSASGAWVRCARACGFPSGQCTGVGLDASGTAMAGGWLRTPTRPTWGLLPGSQL